MRRRPLILAAAVLLPLGTCGGIIAYQKWWAAGAERAVRAAIESVRDGKTLPHGVQVHAESSAAGRIPRDPAIRYALTEGDYYLAGLGYFDAFVSPGAWVAEVPFANGPVVEFEVQRSRNEWVVWLRNPHVAADSAVPRAQAPGETAQN